MDTIAKRRTWTKIVAVGAALIVLAAMPAAAAVGVDQALEPDGPSGWSCAGCAFGQTFVPEAATITGVDLALTSTTWAARYDTLEVTIHAGGPDGPLLGSVSERRSVPSATGADGWQQFTFTDPITITPGQTYFLGFRAELGRIVPLATPSNVDRYAPGTSFQNGAPVGGDLYFRTYGELDVSTDADGDGVDDADDRCADTDPEAPAPPSWNKNRFWTDADGAFVDGKGNPSGLTLADTGGCDGHQIIEAAGLGTGHATHGLSKGELHDWAASVSAA